MNVNDYIWKDRKITNNYNEKQVAYKLVDMDECTLNKAYEHCKSMLYNKDPKNLGRFLILEEINKQLEYCYAEIALRWFKSRTDKDGNNLYTDQSLLMDLRIWQNSKEMKGKKEESKYVLSDFVQVPPEIKNVYIEDLKKACMNSLPLFNHSRITNSFLYKVGIYFTQQELKDLDKYTKSYSIKEKIEILKMQLEIKNEINININPSGLTEKEFTDMIHLKKFSKSKKCKYSELTSDQLKTLITKVLFLFENKVKSQIKLWKDLMAQIEEVAEYNNYKLI